MEVAILRLRVQGLVDVIVQLDVEHIVITHSIVVYDQANIFNMLLP